MTGAPFKRWSLTGLEARPETRKGRSVSPAQPPRVRLHLTPAGIPLETSNPEQLRALAEDLARAIAWLEAELGPELERDDFAGGAAG